MSEREDKPSTRTQDAIDAVEGCAQIRNIHQRKVTKHAIESCIIEGSEGVGVILQIDDAQGFRILILLSNLEHFRGQIHPHHSSSSLRQRAREHALAAGKVTDALSTNIAEQVENGGKNKVMHEHVCLNALVIPVCNLIFAGLSRGILL